MKTFQFGDQTIRTRVNVMVPRRTVSAPLVDVTAAMDAEPALRTVRLTVVGQARTALPVEDDGDPFATVEI